MHHHQTSALPSVSDQANITFIVVENGNINSGVAEEGASENGFLSPVVTYTQSAQPGSFTYTESEECEQLSPVIPSVTCNQTSGFPDGLNSEKGM